MFIWSKNFGGAINSDKIMYFKINWLDRERMVLPINSDGEECGYELIAMLSDGTKIVYGIFKTLESAQDRLACIVYDINEFTKQKHRT